MARFKIVGSRSTSDPDIVDFDVVNLEGNLSVDEEFVVYDTHHPLKCRVIAVTSRDLTFTLRCWLQHGIGWENQFADAIVDTKAIGRPEAFRYEH
jgi:hypothetical protein